MTKEEYENRIAELQTQIDELKKAKVEEDLPTLPHPRWKPERDEHYYTIDIGGACAGWETWDSDNLDGDIYSLGFVFKTEAEAEFAIERMKVLAEMREWAGNWNAPYVLYYGFEHGKVFAYPTTNVDGALKFRTEEDAYNCIKAVGEDRIKRYYFMIPEEEKPMTRDNYEERIAELKDRYEERINELQDRIYELTEKPKLRPPHPRWKPKDNELYYTNTGYGETCNWFYYSTGDDTRVIGRYSIGNTFRTEAEAEFAAERLKVLAEMQEWAGHNYDGAYIYYHRPSDEIMVNWDGDSTNCFGDIRFKCVDDALNCIKAVGKERLKKYYFIIPEEAHV